MKNYFALIIGFIAGILTTLVNDFLIKVLDAIPKGMLVYKLIVGAFIGLLVGLLFYLISDPQLAKDDG